MASIHAARAHRYGHVQFGPKGWYKEAENVSKKLTSQEDRRKFRQGLKCNLDFLNQLNMHDLMSILLEGEQGTNDLPKAVQSKLTDIFECLHEIPIIDILKLINDVKANKILSTIEKIVSLAHVNQSIGNYFARDDALDPALSTICQALRDNAGIEFFLEKRGGTFQSLTAAFHHLKSPDDRDLVGSTHTPWERRNYTPNPYKKRRPLQGNCWFFQKHGRCSKRDCRFDHKCARCGKRSHGETNCRSRRGQ